jgi:hydrogenase/urease accessory protein HupE
MEKPMRLKLSLASIFTVAALPAFAHPEHGFQLPAFMHAVTEPDHLAIGLFLIVAIAVAGTFAFTRLRK